MTESNFRLLLFPPYIFVGCIVFIALIMGGRGALSNLVFAVIWMAIPYALAQAAKQHLKSSNAFQVVWIISAWLFCFLLFPVGDALRFIGIDL